MSIATPTLTSICAEADTAERLAIDRIIEDAHLQVRAVHQPTAQRYATMLRDDERSLDPLTVYLVDGDHLLVDGWHRLEAHRLAGLAQARAAIVPGTRRQAWLAAITANARHGRALTQKEKRRAVQRLLEDQELALESNRALARLVGCSHTLVAELRAPIEEAAAHQRAEPAPQAPAIARRSPPERLRTEKDRRRWVILDLLQQHLAQHALSTGLPLADLATLTGYEPAALGRVLRAMVKVALVRETLGIYHLAPDGHDFLRCADGAAASAGAEPLLSDQYRTWPVERIAAAATTLAEHLRAAPWTYAQFIDLVQDYVVPEVSDQLALEILADRIDDWLADCGYVDHSLGGYDPTAPRSWRLTDTGLAWADTVATAPRNVAPAGSPQVAQPHRPEEVPEIPNPRRPKAQPQPPVEDPRPAHATTAAHLRYALADCIEATGARAPVPSHIAMALAVVIGIESGQASYPAVIERESAFVDVVREQLIEHLRSPFSSLGGLPSLPQLRAIWGIDSTTLAARAEQLAASA